MNNPWAAQQQNHIPVPQSLKSQYLDNGFIFLKKTTFSSKDESFKETFIVSDRYILKGLTRKGGFGLIW